MKKRNSKFGKFLAFVAGIMAVIMLVALTALLVNVKFSFIPYGILYNCLEYAVWFGGLALVVLVSGWAAFKCNWFFRILYLLIVAGAAFFFIWGGVYELIYLGLPLLI